MTAMSSAGRRFALAHRRHRVEQPHRQRLLALLALRDAELDPRAVRQGLDAVGQGGGVDEDVAAVVVAGQEAEALLGVEELDLAGGHEDLLSVVGC